MEVADIARIVGPVQPRISPSGDHAVLVAKRTNLEENRREGSLLLIDLATGAQKDLAPHRPRVADPRWSPSGDRLAFVDAGDEGVRQLFVLPMDGGEAKRITDGEEGVRFYRWGPDGSAMVYGKRAEAEEEEGIARHNRSFEVGLNSYLTESAPRPTHLWRVSAEGGEAEQLTSGVESVDGFAWTPDGQRLVLEVQPSAHTGVSDDTWLEVLDLASGERRVVVPEGRFAGRPGVSPDGSLISFHAERGDEPYFVPVGVWVLPTDGGEPVDVTSELDRDLVRMAWLPDESGMLVAGPDQTTRAVWLQPLEGPARRLDLGRVEPLSPMSVSDGGRVVFTGTEPHRPPELYVMEGPEWRPRRVTGFNDEIAALEMGRVETVTWPGPDGIELTAVLTYPPDYREGKQYPLMLAIHGGPMSTSTEGFGRVPAHLYAAKGWLVFQPNYRGSNNQGKTFQRAIINDAGEGPARDVMSGVELLEERGIVDDSHIAVSGWSYGGFMAVWLTAHYDGWAAAVAGAPVTDWFDWYSMADLNVWAGYGLGGSPWVDGNAENYRRQSPITYAHRIRTPTLILSTTGDERVTVSQSYKLFHALRDNDVEVEFVAYPTGGHFPRDPVHEMDVFRRWIGWIEAHFEADEEDVE